MSISTQTFNPHRTPTERLVGLTVGREGLIRRIIESLKASDVGDSMPQWLVTGQRGMGKTHLLLYLFNLVRGEEILNSQWEVLHLREEEYWKTHSAATFVRLLVQRLAARESQASDEDQALLTAVAEELMTMPSSQEMFNRARAALERFARTSGRRILVGAENLDALFHQFRDPLVEGRMLRDILQHGSVSLIGTSITTELGSDLEDNKNPLYRLFRIEPLARFTFEQQEMQLQRLADLEEDDTARKKVTSFLREQKSSLQVIHRLSGGNPRLGVILYGVLAGPGRVLESIDLLHSLLDINTPYFQDRIKDLAPLERPLAAAFCEAETTLTGAEAARLTGQDRNKVYSLLARLRKAGFIESVEWAARPGRRGNHYQVAEDLLRMWWQYRFDQQSLVKKIVEFLALVYNRDELEDLRSTYCKWASSPSGCDYPVALVNSGFKYTEEALELQRSDWFRVAAAEMELSANKRKVKSLVTSGFKALEDNKPAEAEVIFREAVELDPGNSGAWSNMGTACGIQEKFDEAVDALKRAAKIDPKSPVILCNLGKALGGVGVHAESEISYRKATELAPEMAETWSGLAMACHYQEKHDAARDALRRALKIDPARVDDWFNLGMTCVILDLPPEAEVAFQQVVDLEPERTEAWNYLGIALGIQEKHSEASATLEEAVKLHQEDADLWFVLGISLSALAKDNEAVAAYQRSLDLDPADPTRWGILAKVMMKVGDMRSARGLVDRLLSLQGQPGGSEFAAIILVAEAGAADLEEVVGLIAERLAASERRDEDLSVLIQTAVRIVIRIPDIEDAADLHVRAGLLDTLASSDERMASIGILKHVLNYFLAMLEPGKERRKKSLTPMERAQEVLVRVPGELREAVRDLIERVEDGAAKTPRHD